MALKTGTPQTPQREMEQDPDRIASPDVGARRQIPMHLLVAASAWGSRLINMAVQLLSMRLLLPGLGTDQYGAYVMLNSLANWYLLTDFGLGYSLQNYISECRARGRNYREYVSAALLSGAVLLVLAGGLLLAVSPSLGPLLLRRFSFLSDADKTHVFLVTGLFFALTGISNMGLKFWYAIQKGYLSNLLGALASLLTLAGVLWVIHSHVPHPLLWGLTAVAAPPGMLGLAAVAAMGREANFAWSLEKVALRLLWRRAAQFGANSLLSVLVLQVNYIVMGQVLPNRDLVVYNLADRVFGSAYTLYIAALAALWPVVAELVAHSHWDQVQRHIRTYLIGGLSFMASVTVLFLLFERPVVAILSPKDTLVLAPGFLLLFGAYQMVAVWTGLFSVVLQSKSDMKPFLIIVSVQALLCAPLQWALAHWIGLPGIVLGLLISYLLTTAWALPARVWYHVRRAEAT